MSRKTRRAVVIALSALAAAALAACALVRLFRSK
jgi:hypothetical protein